MKKNVFLTLVMVSFFFIVNHGLYAQVNQKKEVKPSKQDLFDKIESLTGAKGNYIEGEKVFKVGFPRSDLNADILGAKLTPPMGLSVWAAFKINGDNSMVMGDLVLLEDQVNSVMSVALDNGLEVTALHNHFLWEAPRVMFMHISGMGESVKLATAVGKVFAKIKETESQESDNSYTDITPDNTTLDPGKIDNILGVKGEMISGVYKITIGRVTTMHGEGVANAMGVNTWVAFAGGDEQAIADGDFAMLESEVQPVLKALRAAGINITAIHNHMIGEYPRIVFLHFWGTGPTVNLAKGLKSALAVQGK